MYMSRIELDISARKTMMALAAPNMFHAAIESSFREPGRNLWRIDRLSGKIYLLIVSETKPDLTGAAKQFGWENGWETREYDAFLSGIQEGDRRRFRLCANPVITKSAGSGARGSVLAHVTVAQQENWLLERAERHGFSLQPEDYSLMQSKWVSFHKGNDNGRNVRFRTATFEGILTVTDAELFRDALINGIGREKAYGCGLITVTRNES